MINLLGKAFVLIVFSLSLLFLALAIGVYSNHVRWKSKTKDQPGIVDKLEGRIKDLAYSRDRAVARYGEAYSNLGQYEQLRLYRQTFYKAKLEMVVSGQNEKG